MSKGLFSSRELKPKLEGRSKCIGCKLGKTCASPNIQISGNGEKGIMLVGEAPGRMEDLKGEAFVGESGEILDKVFESFGIVVNRDCWKTNVLRCRPPNNRKPTPAEISRCVPQLWTDIKRLRPKVIVLLGGIAVHGFLMNRWPEDPGRITKWRGWQIPDRDAGTWVVPTYHPAYILREKNGAALTVFCQDISRALQCLSIPFPVFPREDKAVEILRDPKEIIAAVLGLDKTLVSVDFETTGLKPYDPGHSIRCVSFTDKNRTIAFPLLKTVIPAVRRVLANPGYAKTAHNVKFEDLWANVILGTKVRNWVWDTMVAAHIIDNRDGITSLDFQAYVNYGLLDYSSHIKPYLQATSPGANSKNSVYKAPMKQLLIYNGIDTLVQRRLALDQMDELGLLFPDVKSMTHMPV